MGFVLIQHLDPEHESALPQILARVATIPVCEAADNLPVEEDHIYVIPPNRAITIASGSLKLHPRSMPPAPTRAIDFFLESLARDQHERAIGIILSGTASDGTLGLCAVKEEGGITFAQDRSAAYESMPRNAIAAGCVDFVLPPDAIARELARIAVHPSMAQVIRGEIPISPGTGPPNLTGLSGAPADEETRVKRILRLLRNHAGVDFSLYKSSTLERRVNRRMVLARINTLEGYADFLQSNPRELDALYSDVLVNVTSFFRDPEGFTTLKEEVFPRILAAHQNDPVRAWIVGCSSGEEAYSLAMTFLEAKDNSEFQRELQIFATDLHDAVLDKARAGLYPKAAVQDVSRERLRRFFVEEEGGYRVNRALRDMCIFARQNFTGDPPFSRIDLISCRNVLIYLGTQLQQKALPVFHYALKPGGFLFLGASESIGSSTDLFEPFRKEHRIFTKRAVPTPMFRMHFAPVNLEGKTENLSGKFSEGARQPEPDMSREADIIILDKFSPPGVLIDRDLQILQFRGDTSPFLRLPAGKATLRLLKMTKQGLVQPLRAAIRKCQVDDKTVRQEGVVTVLSGSQPTTLNLEVIPVKRSHEICYLVLFEEESRRPAERPAKRNRSLKGRAPARGKKTTEADDRIAELERELVATREEEHTLEEQHEIANEALQAYNEEIQSGNEELQSINEELQTSQEELESANEELTTVNEELASRNQELVYLNNDLKNLQLSINTGIVLMGRDLTIRSFTPPAGKILNLIGADVGRPFGRIRGNLEIPELEQLVGEAIDTASLREREAQDKNGRWFSLRIRPYLTMDNRVDGAVLMLVDIDALKRSEQAIAATRDYAEGILRSIRYPLVVLTADMRIDTANAAFYATFKLRPTEIEGRSFYEVCDGQWNIPRLRELLDGILPRNDFFNDFEITQEFAGIGRRTMLLNGRILRFGETGAPERILLAIDDITESKQLDSVRRSESRYRRLFEAAKDGILIVDSQTRTITDANPVMCELLELTREEMIGRELHTIGLFPNKATTGKVMDEVSEKGSFRSNELQFRTKTGESRYLELVSNFYAEADSTVFQFNVRDITDRVENARQLASARDAAEEANRAKDKFLAALSHELRTPLTPILIVSSTMERSPKLASELRQTFAMIRKNIRQEARLIDDLLDLTGIAQGRLKFRFSELDIHPLIQESLEALRADIGEKQLKITLDLSAPEHYVRADAVRLRQIFGNLLGNAIKFTPSSGQISVRSLNAGKKLHIEITDTGLGISEKELPRIFGEFFQGEEAASLRFGGVGLGLFTTAFLVREHGGRIWAESGGRHHGATFHVEFPVSSAPAPLAAPSAPGPSRGALRILLVEDHQATRETLAKLLTRRGHTVSGAETIAQGRLIAKTNKFDIVISDIGLPDGRGHDLMRELKRDFSLPGIALSGYGMESDILQSHAAGFSAHLTKPVDLAVLEEAIQRAMTAA